MTKSATAVPGDEAKAIIAALNHPFRRTALRFLLQQGAPYAPVDYLKKPGPGLPATSPANQLSFVAYHFGVLEKADLLELVSTEPRRGAVKHLYLPKKTARRRISQALKDARELS